MWTRKELKEKGKAAMKRNYWKTVLVSIVLAFLVSGAPFSGASGIRAGSSSADEAEESIINLPGMPGDGDEYDEAFEYDLDAEDDAETIPEEFTEDLNEFRDTVGGLGMVALTAGMFLLFLVLFATLMAVHAFLLNPLEVGTSRFFLRNLNNPAEIGELTYAYDHSYLNTVKTVFLKNLYIFLWLFLLIIPAIIKSYEYRMVEYILAEHPEMSTKEVLAKSRAMMKGNKWKAFVLDLSFIGWHLLSLITLGLVGVFYVMPYKNMTNAALYEYLEYGRSDSDMVVWGEA